MIVRIYVFLNVYLQTRKSLSILGDLILSCSISSDQNPITFVYFWVLFVFLRSVYLIFIENYFLLLPLKFQFRREGIPVNEQQNLLCELNLENVFIYFFDE